MKKLFAISATALMLTACGAPSVDELVNDEELLIKELRKCQSLKAQGKNIDTEECNNVDIAGIRLMQNAFKNAKGN